MGIVNVTPDSFSDGGEFLEADAAVAHGERLAGEGASVLDIGGESTRPGAEPVPADEELRRVIPVIERLAVAERGAWLSVDTTKLDVARAALDAGARIVNDVSAFRFAADLAGLVAEREAHCVLMHMLGEPRTMQADPRYDDVVDDVKAFLSERLAFAVAEGVSEDRVWLDPGIGFGKTPKQNLELIGTLDRMVEASQGVPIMVGASRKSFIGKLLGDVPTDDRFAGSLAAATIAIWNGASILRVHDVKATVEILKTVDAIRSAIKSGDLVMSTA